MSLTLLLSWVLLPHGYVVLPAMFLGHMAHEEILSQRAYRRARVRARAR